MASPRRLTSTTPGPAHLHIEMHGVPGTVTVHADPAHRVAAVTVMTDDDTGPSAEAVAGARLTNDNGRLAVRIEGRTGTATTTGRAGRTTITISGNIAGRFIVNGATLDGMDVVSPVEVIAHVPPGSTVTTNTLSADVHTTGQLAALDATSISGDVCARGPIGQLHANTTSGDVRFTAAQQARVNSTSGGVRGAALTGHGSFRSISGDIEVHASGRAEVTASAVSGDIDITSDQDAQGNRPTVSAHSISGVVHTPRG